MRDSFPGSGSALLLFAALVFLSFPLSTSARTPLPTSAQSDSAAKVEAERKRWLEYQEASRSYLDDGFLFSFGIGLSPTLMHVSASGGNTIDFPDQPPYPDVNFRGMGGVVDIKLGWLVENQPFLEDYWFGDDRLHDQLFITLDFMARATPKPQWRFATEDTTNQQTFLRPYLLVDMIGGVGTTYIVHPYGVSLSSMVGLGFMALQGSESSVRTSIGPAFNLRVGQEWHIRENWRTGFGVNYGFVRGINPSHQDDSGRWSYREAYSSHLFSILWITSITPPGFRRASPPVYAD